jgi:hypothetical protein
MVVAPSERHPADVREIVLGVSGVGVVEQFLHCVGMVRQAPTGSSSTDGPARKAIPAAPSRNAAKHSTR